MGLLLTSLLTVEKWKSAFVGEVQTSENKFRIKQANACQ